MMFGNVVWASNALQSCQRDKQAPGKESGLELTETCCKMCSAQLNFFKICLKSSELNGEP